MLELQVPDFEIFRKMYYNQKIPINGKDYWLSQCPYLDIILTDHCNANCKFCVADLVHDKEACTLDKHMDQIRYAVTHLNVKEVLLLGGEPTVSKNLLPIIDFLKTLDLDKICITTNGLRLKNPDYRCRLLNSGITNMNISVMSLDAQKQRAVTSVQNSLTLEDLEKIWEDSPEEVNIRINNNVFRGNNDSVPQMVEFYQHVREFCDSVKFSPLLKTDAFSTVNAVTEFTAENILPDHAYEELWRGLEEWWGAPVVRNTETLGFVEYAMILIDTPIVLNYNHRGNMMKKVTAERKINSIKLLANGRLSLSWNREMPEYYIQ